MEWFVANVLGMAGVIGLVGFLFFILAYKNSIKVFAWFEDQTFGTRDYILNKCELLFYDIKSEHITYTLLSLNVILPIIIATTCAIFGKFILGVFLAIIVGVTGWKGPRPLMNYLVAKRISMYRGQMVDGLNLLSNGLRAGLSLPQSLGLVVDELPVPISQEFNLILQQNKIGVPLEDCFEDLNKRVPTEDNQMFVTSVNILRETGGNLAETFDTIAGVIRERVRLQQKIETYIAQGKFQGGMIFLMPFLMLLMFSVSDPESVAPLFNTIVGGVVLFAALGLDMIGGFLMWKVIQIKV
jgi:tight adherence protein B